MGGPGRVDILYSTWFNQLLDKNHLSRELLNTIYQYLVELLPRVLVQVQGLLVHQVKG